MSALHLLGEGLDAIIQHTRRPTSGLMALVWPEGTDDPRLPIQPTEVERLERYNTAAALFPAERDPVRAGLRCAMGERFRQEWVRAWHAGERPDLERVIRRASLQARRRRLRLVSA